MKNGDIISNSSQFGGGVYIDKGLFSMKGGKISNNIVSNVGGGIYLYYGDFEKTGGIITGYSSDSVSGNVVKDGGGAILDNKGHAIYAYASTKKGKDKTSSYSDNLQFINSTNTISGEWDF